MPSPRLIRRAQRTVIIRAAIVLSMFAAGLSLANPIHAQIASATNLDGRKIFVNAEPPTIVKLTPFTPKAPRSIYLGGEIAFMGKDRPAMNLDRDGAEKLVREAAERHHVDPALVRAVIETESNWNPAAKSRKGALGLMQLIPTTASRFGVNDAFNPQQNVDAGVHYLKTLLERYNGNLDLALAAYNAGEGAVDRAHGVPSYRETRNYVQKVQNAYFRPGSGRMESAFVRPNPIHRQVDASGRIVFTNE
ncbi:MAG TPA: lytic transglycosylase domain-containing protein [Candidatus Acidoferrum sp.]